MEVAVPPAWRRRYAKPSRAGARIMGTQGIAGRTTLSGVQPR